MEIYDPLKKSHFLCSVPVTRKRITPELEIYKLSKVLLKGSLGENSISKVVSICALFPSLIPHRPCQIPFPYLRTATRSSLFCTVSLSLPIRFPRLLLIRHLEQTRLQMDVPVFALLRTLPLPLNLLMRVFELPLLSFHSEVFITRPIVTLLRNIESNK